MFLSIASVRPAVLALAFALALGVVLGDGGAAYQNDYGEDLTFECPHREMLYTAESVHANYAEDRKWRFTCRQAPSGATPGKCDWTDDYINAWDEAVSFVCPPNRVLAGIHSYHSSFREDRRMRFKCCKDGGFLTKSCTLSGYLNDLDDPMSYTVQNGKVPVGWFSFYNNIKNDRRHKILECSYKQ